MSEFQSLIIFKTNKKKAASHKPERTWVLCLPEHCHAC